MTGNFLKIEKCANTLFFKKIGCLTSALLLAAYTLTPLCAQNQAENPALFRSMPVKPSLSPRQQHYLDVIRRNEATRSVQLIDLNIEALRGNTPITLPGLTGDLNERNPATLVSGNLELWQPDNWAWTGKVADYPLSLTHFVYRRGHLRGKVAFSGLTFLIRPLGEGLHVLVQVDGDALPSEGCHEIHDRPSPKHTLPPNPEKSEEVPESSASNCRIRLLVAYTDDVAANYADPLGDIQDAVLEFNQTNGNSSVSHRVELACVEQFNYAESDNASTDLGRFMDTNDGFLDDVHALRIRYDADMCCLLADNFDGVCGLAPMIRADYARAFQVTEYGCMLARYTFVHEFGHLLGADHDPYVNHESGSNKGYVNLADNWRTIMAYDYLCEDNNTSCPRIPYWSNPAVNYGGDPIGSAGVHDNESAIDAYDATIAALEAYVFHKHLTQAETIGDGEAGYHIAQAAVLHQDDVAITFQSGSEGSYTAGSHVELRPGFWARAGTVFTARLDECSDNFFTNSSEDRSDDAVFSEKNVAASDFSAQALPNVFQSGLTLSLDMNQAALCVAVLTDLQGRTLQTLLPATHLQAGSHQFPVETLALPAGIYLVRIQVGKHIQVRKVVCLGI